MEALLTVEFVAEAVGDFVGEVTVKSELNVITLSCSAKVLPPPGQENSDGGLRGEASALSDGRKSSQGHSSGY